MYIHVYCIDSDKCVVCTFVIYKYVCFLLIGKWVFVSPLHFRLPTCHRFERGGHARGGIQGQPTLGGKVFSLTEVIFWLESLLAALDCYNWVLEEQLVSPSEVFQCEY